MNRFHRRCGDRVTLLNHNITAIRNFVEFNHGLILGAEPLVDDVMFEVKIDRKVNVWNGSLEIGVTTLDPEFMELPATATKLRNTAWILSGNSIVKDGVTLVSVYGPELDTLREGDCVGVVKTSKAELMFFINGRCLGVAAKDLPPRLFAVIDLYGQCVQVSIMYHSSPRTPMDAITQIEPYVSDEDEVPQQNEAAAWTSDPKETRDAYLQMPLSCPLVSQDHLRFHPRCGILVKLSANNKTAERARPLDDYNNGVVMTHRPLYDNELFEIRIDRLVDKWSGSIEVGVTTHNPATIRFPSTMTNMDTGTIMMSGCKVLLNGHGTCMEYGNFNLDELREGDTVGMMRKSNGKLHYFINGIDQGVATDKVPTQVWGVIDLYGMTVKVTIVDPCEDLDSNINHLPIRILSIPEVPSTSTYRPAIDEESLLFHTLRDSNVIIINDGKTAHRPNAFEYFNNGIVMTNRTLKTNELFQVRLDLVIPKWAGSIEIGVTQNSSKDIKFPFKMSNAKSGTWAVTGEDVIRDGTIIIPQYVRNLNKLMEGDTVGVMRKEMGILHFVVNGIDQGPAAFNIPEHVFGIIDLYGRVAQATIVDTYTMPPFVLSPDSPISTESNTTVFPEMCFHRVHGRNARLSRNRLTASRATVYSEFNDAVLFSSRPLRECDMFELRIDKMVDCWIGSLEIGVTAIKPDDLEASGGVGAIAGTATDLSWDTYILSGSAMMKDGECVRSGYPLDLDTLTAGSRVGIMWHADRSLHYYLDGMDMGKAWYVPHLNIYAVVDLYGQCTQVTILQNEERAFNYNGCNSDLAIMSIPRPIDSPPPPYWSFSEYCGDNIVLMHDYSIARRMTPDPMGAIVFSSAHLIVGEIYEIKILECKYGYAGSFRMGITDINILNANVNRHFPLTVSWLPPFTAYVDGKYLKYTTAGNGGREIKSFVPSFDWLRPGDRLGFNKTADSRVIVYYNSEPLDLAFENVPDKVYVVMEMFGHVNKIQAVSRGTTVVPSNQQTIPNDNGSRPQTQTNNTDANADNVAIENAVQDVKALTDNHLALGDFETVVPMATIASNVDGNAQVLPPDASYESEAFLPSAPTMAALESGSTPEPPMEGRASIEPAKVLDSDDSSSIEPDEVLAAAKVEERPANLAGNEVAASLAGNLPPELRRGIRALPYTFHYMHGRNIRLCSSDTVAMRVRGHSEGVAVASQPLRRGNHFRFRVDKITNEWQGTMCIGAVAVLPNEVPPRSALHIDSPAWVITNDVLMNRGIYRLSEIGRNLDDITENSVLTLHFRFNSELTLEVDGVMRGTIAVIPRVFTQIYPTIDLYGRIIQVSILLHPHVVLGGNSLDLPVIEENCREDSPNVCANGHDDDDDESPDNGGDENSGSHLWNESRNKRRIKRNYSNVQRNVQYDDSYNDPRPGPSSRPDRAPRSVPPRDNDVKNKEIKCRRVSVCKESLHHSLILPENFVIDNDEAAKIFGIQKSQSTQNFSVQDEEEEEEEEDSKNFSPSAMDLLSLGSRMLDDDDSLEVDVCDTNIRHNDRYPEANDVDNLDNEIVDAMTLETGNLPDLTEEQSPSIDESTRRDDFWADGLSIENLNYLNDIICWVPDDTEMRFADRNWVFYSETNGNCEHMHLALKYWNYLVLPYPDMREVVASGLVRCYCQNCSPDTGLPLAGWVRIERARASGDNHVFWHVVRSTLVSASALSGEGGDSRRPRNLADAPSMNPPTADIWFDEEGKPHHTVLALDIDAGATEADDKLLAYMIFLRSHITFNDETIDPLSFED